MCPHTLYMCPDATEQKRRNVHRYTKCVLILLCVSSYYYMCPHPTIHGSLFSYSFVLILLDMCTIHVPTHAAPHVYQHVWIYVLSWLKHVSSSAEQQEASVAKDSRTGLSVPPIRKKAGLLLPLNELINRNLLMIISYFTYFNATSFNTFFQGAWLVQ